MTGTNTSTCQRCNSIVPDRATFCPDCGLVVDRDGLLRTARRIHGFTGTASLNPRIERFWETGDPSVVYRNTHDNGELD